MIRALMAVIEKWFEDQRDLPRSNEL